MTTFFTEQVLEVYHWKDTLFSFKTSRSESFRFHSGQFVMVGLEIEGKPLVRAYSIASAYYEEFLEFFSINIPGGTLTSRLQYLKAGDKVLISKKPTGTLLLHDLLPGKHLYLLATGTGLAPFLSLIKDPHIYDAFEKVILVHGVRHVDDLAYSNYITHELPHHEFLGSLVKEKLIYYPTVTREPFHHQGRITHLIKNNKLSEAIDLPKIHHSHDRFMICGSPSMLEDTCLLLNERDFFISPHIGEAGHYLIERAFVER